MHLLGVCQVLELAIKLYISRKQYFLESGSGNHLSSEKIYDEVKDFPLGLLIQRLKKLDGNKGLIENLKIIKEDRDYLAHQALLTTYNLPIDFLKKFNNSRKRPEFLDMNNQMTECLVLISQLSQNYSSN